MVSIIMPTYQSSDYISETIDTVINQTYPNWELLITDDASEDNTVEIIKKYSEKDARINLVSLYKNQGAAVARNNSLSRVKGRYVAFLDSDDLWLPDKLEKQLNFMKSKSSVFSFTCYETVDQDGNIKEVVDMLSKSRVGYDDMLKKKATMGCSTVIIDREKTGDFRFPNIRTGQDYALWLYILKKGIYADCLKEVLTKYRIRPNSISRNKFRKSLRQWEIYRDLEGLSWVKSAWCFLFYAYNAVFRK